MGQVPDDLKDVAIAAAEVDSLRERTQSLVDELERRLRARAGKAREIVDRTRAGIAKVRRAVDVKQHWQAHPRATLGVTAAAALALGIGVYFATRPRRRSPLERLRARASAYGQLLAHPELALPRRGSFGKRLVTALLVAGATTIMRNLTHMMMQSAVAARQLPPREE